jgi:dienelactone hydrolase
MAVVLEMAAAGVTYRFISYPGARHSSTNPDADQYAQQFKMPSSYPAEADRASREKLPRFFAEIFRYGLPPGHPARYCPTSPLK